MAMKLTICKRRSEEAGVEEHAKNEREAESAQGKEKILIEMGELKGRIFNVEQDIKNLGSSAPLQTKLKFMQARMEWLNGKLKDENI